MKNAALILSTGKYFLGESFGFFSPTIEDFFSLTESTHKDAEEVLKKASFFAGEVVFNTAMSGYVEVLSDPSFSGQLVCMTYPHIGNYGVDVKWSESGSQIHSEIHIFQGSHKSLRKEIQASGLIVKDVYRGPVQEGRVTLDAWMKQEKICGISDIDTRLLTLHLRDNGAENAVILSFENEEDLQNNLQTIVTRINELPHMEGRDLVREVGLKHNISLDNTIHSEIIHVGVLDFGCKHNIIRLLEERNCKVHLFKDDISAEEILVKNLDMILVSNGPGDPSVLEAQKDLIMQLMGKIPICGICLGTQLLALSIGARTYKLPFGHHGINHPVRDISTDKLFITSQNHGFAVDITSLPKGAEPWFINTNDNTLEGFIYPQKQIYSVQFHPESAPGPVDTLWIFDYFIERALAHKTDITH